MKYENDAERAKESGHRFSCSADFLKGSKSSLILKFPN